MESIKIEFEFTTQRGVYRDALYLPENHGLSEEELNVMKQERLDNWLYVIENPEPPPPDTIVIDGVTYEKILVDGQILLKPVGE